MDVITIFRPHHLAEVAPGCHMAATLGVSAVAQVPTIPGAWHIPKNGALNGEKLRFEWEILRALLETYMNIYDNI